MSFAKKSLATVFVLFVMTGAGCEETSLTTNISDVAENKEAPKETVTSVPEGFNATTLIPEEAVIQNVYDLDLDADGVTEHAVEYSIDRVIDQNGQSIPKAYLEVFVWDDMGNIWTSIKEDEIDTRLRKFEIEVLHFDTSPRDYLLVSKPSLPHGYTDGYYVFGDVSNDGGLFGDLPLAKAYLHEEDYLNEGDATLYFRGVSVSSDALIEHYDVSCDAKEYTEPRFGDAPGDAFGPCRRLEISHVVTEDGFASEATITRNTTAE